MDNKQFPDGEEIIPEALTFTPAEPDAPIPEEEAPDFDSSEEAVPPDSASEEDMPVIEEIPQTEPAAEEEAAEPASEENTAEPAPEEEAAEPASEENTAEPAPEEASPDGQGIPETPRSDAEEVSVQESASADRGKSFMERIPDVGEDAPSHDGLTEPEVGSELTPDSHALDSHGMLEHGQEEPPFDMSILDDPELQEVLEEQMPEEEPQEDSQEYRDNPAEPEPAPEQPAASRMRPVRKGRPKKRGGEGLFGIPHILVTIVWLALIVVIGVTLGRMIWVCASDVLAFGREDKPVTITIYESDTMEDITEKLYDAGLIRYRSLFNFYASISDAKEDIDPGIYDLNTRYDYHALVNMMSARSTREVVKNLLIPEGYTCRQIFALLEENRVCTAQDLASYAASGELKDYWFLENVQRGDKYCLEGFLFPDTYDFYKNSSPREVLEKLLDNFDHRFSEEMRAQIDNLNATVTDGSFTVREVTIVASLIEKETAAAGESPRIAGVIYNRLFRWDYPALLNIDAAIIYAQDGVSDHIDTSLDSPYNTYRNVGLPPTPIANPGLASLQAALNPEAHDYYYYVLNPATGMHQFSTTQEEHEQYRAQFAAEAAAARQSEEE
ncbi:MAG: endolytic transglycosylase MltG [Firmicutes bacterium]|nr:endolytic transglycosylase MltG [Bacillota bacterium]